MFKGLLKFLPVILHEVVDLLIEKVKERRKRKKQENE